MTALSQAEMPSMVALSPIRHLGALLEVVSKTKAPAMVVHTHAILVLEDLRHHVGSDSFALPFGFPVKTTHERCGPFSLVALSQTYHTKCVVR